MHRHWHIIEPLCAAARARVIVEIGAEAGKLTRHLLDYVLSVDGHLHAIEPALSDNAELFTLSNSHLTLHAAGSLEVLPELQADAVLIDGDHNWYTVFHELQNIAAWKDAPLVVLHDMDWPYGRRDMYYEPSRIPEDVRQPCAKRGAEPGSPLLLKRGGCNARLWNALTEGGARNGVRTAIEDFLAEARGQWDVQYVAGLHGLGVLVPDRLRANTELASVLSQLKAGPLLQAHLEALEARRIQEHLERCALEEVLRNQRGEMQKDTHEVERLRLADGIEQAERRAIDAVLECERILRTRSMRWTSWARRLLGKTRGS